MQSGTAHAPAQCAFCNLQDSLIVLSTAATCRSASGTYQNPPRHPTDTVLLDKAKYWVIMNTALEERLITPIEKQHEQAEKIRRISYAFAFSGSDFDL